MVKIHLKSNPEDVTVKNSSVFRLFSMEHNHIPHQVLKNKVKSEGAVIGREGSVNRKRMCLCWLLVRDGPGSQLATTSKALPACLKRTCSLLNLALITQGVEDLCYNLEPTPQGPLPKGCNGPHSRIQPAAPSSPRNVHCRAERESHGASGVRPSAALSVPAPPQVTQGPQRPRVTAES